MALRFVLIKASRAGLTLWLAVTFVFVVLRVSGDPVITILGDDASPEMIEAYRRAWGLDQPIWVQYLRYFANIFEGNLGRSFLSGRDATEVVLEHIPQTLTLTGIAFAVKVAIGIPCGVFAALHRNSFVDRTVMVFAVTGYSLPNFFLGIVLILIFTVRLDLLPSGGSAGAANIIMPALTMGTAGAGVLARFTRTSVLETLGRPHIRAAQSRGSNWAQTVMRHVLPNAAIPVVTTMGFMLGSLIGGGLVVETVFAWPGIGRLLVTSVSNRDLAVVQVIILLITATMITANLCVDLLYGFLDPRIRSRTT